MDLSCTLLVLILVVTITYRFLTCTYNEWKNQNVPFVPKPIPGFGHMFSIVCLKENIPTLLNRIYKNTKDSMVGVYFMRTPGVVIRDPQLVKMVLQTNFTNFHNNAFQVNEKDDPVLAKNPFFATDLRLWRETRTRISSHLSGKKMKYLYVIIDEVCMKMERYVDMKINGNNGSFESELRDLFTKCTGEIIANAAFAIEGCCFEDNDDKMSFANVSKTIFEPNFINGIKQALIIFAPRIGHFFGLSFLPKSTDRYFRENVKAIMKMRKEGDANFKDYLQFSLDANGDSDIDSIVADVIVFFSDVYETSSSALSCLLFHLSRNPKIQDKLRAHILSIVEETNGIVTYESIKNMTYLDQVLLESMRLTTPMGAMIKICTEDITLEGSDGINCHLRPGNFVFISNESLHLDEKYWPNPHLFDPDRFSPDNQAKHTDFTYLPFGGGPRICVGMRLGTLLVKRVTVALLLKYKIVVSTKTKVPLEQDPASFMPYYKGGVWGIFEKLDDRQNPKIV